MTTTDKERPFGATRRIAEGAKRVSAALKHTPEDFIVEEIPSYLPSGDGEHVYLWIEKRNLSGEQMLRKLARALDINHRDVSAAGIKDKRAVTRQWVSVPGGCEAAALKFLEGGGRVDMPEEPGRESDDSLDILNVSRHGNKLRSGHLRGNTFTVLARLPEAQSSKQAYDQIAGARESISESGMANYFGPQRFGIAGNTAEMGVALLRGENGLASVPHARRRFMRKLALSAAQSWLFNEGLTRRIEDETLHRVIEGEVLQRCDSGGCFRTQDLVSDQRRLDDRIIVPAGPIFGPKMTFALKEGARREQAIIDDAGLDADDFERFKKLTLGARRPMLLWLDELSVEPVSEGIRFQFTLPSGSYATVLLAEFIEDVLP